MCRGDLSVRWARSYPRCHMSRNCFLLLESCRCAGTRAAYAALGGFLGPTRGSLKVDASLLVGANDLLDAHADLTPIRLALNRHTHNSTLRLLTLPPSNPLYNHICEAFQPVRRFKSPLHNLLQFHNVQASNIETIQHSCLHPAWNPPVRITIPQSEEEAIAHNKANMASARFYSDRSSIDSGIGAAAVLYINNSMQ